MASAFRLRPRGKLPYSHVCVYSVYFGASLVAQYQIPIVVSLCPLVQRYALGTPDAVKSTKPCPPSGIVCDNLPREKRVSHREITTFLSLGGGGGIYLSLSV